jgi:formamidopyrimidine-DNA glycosylase
MPEGPEVWILSKSINLYCKETNTKSYGKHLFILDKKENLSFGLTGKVQLNDKDELIKINSGWLYGEQIKYENMDEELGKLGIDFMTSNENDIKEEVDKWIKSKKKLAGLMLDQSKISGIGVAWGSEILFKAGLRPDIRTCDQNLCTLTNSILYIREKIKNIYEKELKDKEHNYKEFVNKWFSNLYEVREMEVYKKGLKIEVLGRSWWI